ncbi:MAG: hypothetical protein RL514_3145 [Verrucomicrobiota bacterium]|jgi:hypothetical protein
MSASPTLAACLMVRNEAGHLRRCLESLEGEVDAIYVTDTGSTDDSVAVARSFGAVVRSFQWCDDFAAARNASIAGVSEDWLLTLDADDAFPAGEVGKVRGQLAADACVATVRYAIAPTHTPLRTVKLLRNGLGARYEGIVHESVQQWMSAKRAEGWRRLDLDVSLVHWGYTPEAMPGKVARNLPLLRGEWERLQATDDLAPRLHIGAELGLALAQTGRPTEGGELLGQLLRDATTATPVPLTPALKILFSLLWVFREEGKPDAALAVVQMAENFFTGSPAYQLHRGLTELAAGNHAEARAWLERFRVTWTDRELDVAVPAEYLGAKLWEALARCHMGLRDYVSAATCYQRCVELAPADRELQLRLLVAQRKEAA